MTAPARGRPARRSYPQIMVEVVMLKKVFTTVVLGVVASAALLAGGCAADPKLDRNELTERQRYTDDKGHYRPDLRASNRTLHP